MVSAPGGHTWTRMTQDTLGGVPPFLAIPLFFWRAAYAAPLCSRCLAVFVRLHDSPCMSQGHEESPRGLRGQLILFMCKIWLGNCNLNLGHWNWIGITSQTATTSAQVYLTHVFFWFSLSFSWCLETRFYIVRLVTQTLVLLSPPSTSSLTCTSYPLGLFYRRLLMDWYH